MLVCNFSSLSMLSFKQLKIVERLNIISAHHLSHAYTKPKDEDFVDEINFSCVLMPEHRDDDYAPANNVEERQKKK
jgi:hypothetical protein